MKKIQNIIKKIKLNFKQKKINSYCCKLRKKYCKSNVTIISNSCLGGFVYHQLGLRFCSPTINLWIETKGFLAFCKNVDPYFQCELQEINLGCDHPTGIVKPLNVEPIVIHFNHYRTFDEAKAKWDERKKRIIKDKIVIFYDASAMEDISDAFVEKWEEIKYPKLAFGCLDRIDITNYKFINFYNDIKPAKICQYYKCGMLYLNQVNYVDFLNDILSPNIQ